MRRVIISLFFFTIAAGHSIRCIAQENKPILETKIVFSQGTSPKVMFVSHANSPADTETNEIQSALVFYAYAMNRLDDAGRKTLLEQVKGAVPKLATDRGLIRANILQNNPLLKQLPVEAGTLAIITSESPGQGMGFDFQPSQPNSNQLSAGVLCVFQELINKLSESGLRLLTLSMGGMNKWYTEGGQASDPSSVSKAPEYALNLAVDIIEKVTGKKIK